MAQSPQMTKQPFCTGRDVEELVFRPSCFETVLMLPFPFFCVGCCQCVSMSSILNFNNVTQVLNLTTYPGWMCCLAKTHAIRYADVEQARIVTDTGDRVKVKADRNPACHLALSTKSATFPLTAPRDTSRTLEDRSELVGMLRVCGLLNE